MKSGVYTAAILAMVASGFPPEMLPRLPEPKLPRVPDESDFARIAAAQAKRERKAAKRAPWLHRLNGGGDDNT